MKKKSRSQGVEKSRSREGKKARSEKSRSEKSRKFKEFRVSERRANHIATMNHPDFLTSCLPCLPNILPCESFFLSSRSASFSPWAAPCPVRRNLHRLTFPSR